MSQHLSHHANNPNVKRDAQQHYEEGKSPAAWAGSLLALLGFCIILAGVLMGPVMLIIYVGSALVLIAGVLTLVMKQMGYGTPARHYGNTDTPAGNL